MKILRKRILKVVPVWLIIALLLSAGVALAAYTWISNRLQTITTVAVIPVTLSGSIPVPSYQNLWSEGNITYTVNSAKTGYIVADFISGSGAITLSDVSCSVVIFPNSGYPSNGIPVSGYPKVVASNAVEYVFANATAPFTFDVAGGTIEFSILYGKTGVFTGQVQLTSTY